MQQSVCQGPITLQACFLRPGDSSRRPLLRSAPDGVLASCHWPSWGWLFQLVCWGNCASQSRTPTWKTSRFCRLSGMGNSIFLSKRPGLSRAGSSVSALQQPTGSCQGTT